MGTASEPLSSQSQQLNQGVAATASGTGTATFTFPTPPSGQTWTGTLNCATANTGTVFTVTVGAVQWGQFGGNSVYGPVQVFGAGSQQLKVTATGLTPNTAYELYFIGSADPSSSVAPIWPDSNSTALTAQISGTVPVTVSNTVTTNSNITGGSVGVTGNVSAVPAATTINGTGLTGASTTIPVVSTTNFSASGFITVPASGGGLVFAYTGTTASSFTGCTLVVGTAAWTITNGAAVVQNTGIASNANISGGSLTSISNPVASNPNAQDQLLLVTGITSLPYASSSFTATRNYAGFYVFIGFGGTATFTSLVVSNNTQNTGNTLRTTYATWPGYVWVPLQTNAGDSIQIIIGGSGTVTSTQLTVWGYVNALALEVFSTPGRSLDVSPIGGVLSAGWLGFTTSATTILAAPASGTAYKLHGVVFSSLTAANNYQITFISGPLATLPIVQFNATTAALSNYFPLNGLMISTGIAYQGSATGGYGVIYYDIVNALNIT